MKNAIGEMAGSIYHQLEAKGESTVTKLKTALKADTFVLDAALGWLAREDKIELTKAGKSFKVSLKS